MRPIPCYTQGEIERPGSRVQYVHMKNRVFTLIELLVVIAIIGLLASIVIASLSTVQAKARDARRVEDINQLQKALTIYLSNAGTYPVSVATTTLTSTSTVGAALIAGEAMPTMPKDPTDPTYTYQYISNAIGSTYTLNFCLETNTIRGYVQGCTNYVSP